MTALERCMALVCCVSILPAALALIHSESNHTEKPAPYVMFASQETASAYEPFYRKLKPCPPTMKFGFGDAVESPCSADPDGNAVNTYGMKLLAAAVRSAARMPEPNLSMDAPDLTTRVGRVLNPDAPHNYEIFKRLMDRMQYFNGEGPYEFGSTPVARAADEDKDDEQAVCGAGCQRLPTSCCPVRTQIVYPQFGQSAVSDRTFAIIQDFPSFVQPIYKRTCLSDKCNFMRGNCTQKYAPQAVFSASTAATASRVQATTTTTAKPKTSSATSQPLQARKSPLFTAGGASLFSQDFILVESGCECRPDFETGATFSARNEDRFD